MREPVGNRPCSTAIPPLAVTTAPTMSAGLILILLIGCAGFSAGATRVWCCSGCGGGRSWIIPTNGRATTARYRAAAGWPSYRLSPSALDRPNAWRCGPLGVRCRSWDWRLPLAAGIVARRSRPSAGWSSAGCSSRRDRRRADLSFQAPGNVFQGLLPRGPRHAWHGACYGPGWSIWFQFSWTEIDGITGTEAIAGRSRNRSCGGDPRRSDRWPCAAGAGSWFAATLGFPGLELGRRQKLFLGDGRQRAAGLSHRLASAGTRRPAVIGLRH